MERANGQVRVEDLTRRELEVLKLVATGLSTKEIARSLGIAFKTAACHRSRIMAKLDIHEVANLTRYAIRNGYVDIGGTNGNGHRSEAQLELFDRIRVTEAKYRKAMDEYGAFLRERESIGLPNPDSSTGARRLRQAEEMAHNDYHAALVALKDFFFRN
ncbi:MAG TPA: LuxR C-terminal-related transcriptional regulator [Candidatus Sulfopaludibacter sp.]|jgi:DNA-binding CsgD family transcriptional regulator|nr:LuxR C-terminal-related transcriptional regulator [Candidatus Sulfopaludibacter sp.]